MNIFAKQYAAKYSGCFAVGCLVFVLVLAFISIPGYVSMREREKEYKVKESMRKLEEVLDDYSKSHEGYFTIALDTVFVNNLSLINPFNKHSPTITTMTDTIQMKLSLQKGQIAYMPLDINRQGAKRYRIYGKGCDDLELMMFRILEK